VCPIVIKSEINTEAFIEKLRNAEHPLTKFLKWKDETVFLIDLPLPEHCRAISEISEQIYKQQINCPPGSRLIETRDVTTNIGKEGDTSFQPRDKPRPAQGQGCDVRGNAWPNVVVEVGVYESMSELRHDAREWLGPNTDVQLVILIKIYKPYSVLLPPPYRVRMRAELWERGFNTAVQQVCVFILYIGNGR